MSTICTAVFGVEQQFIRYYSLLLYVLGKCLDYSYINLYYYVVPQ
jgi:hypothetical protein